MTVLSAPYARKRGMGKTPVPPLALWVFAAVCGISGFVPLSMTG